MSPQSKIVVRNNNILAPPILVSEDAHIVEFYDSFGDMNALLVRVASDEMWGLVTKNDEDWPAVLARYGYLDPKRPIKDILRHGL